MTVDAVLKELAKKGSERSRALSARHGVPIDRTYGVKVGDLKTIAKRLKGEQDLALALFDTANTDAMYLAGLIADGSKMSRKTIESWARASQGLNNISEYVVPWVACEHPAALSIARKWIKSKQEHIAAAGWCTYVGLLATRSDPDLDIAEIERLLGEIAATIHDQANRVRYTMNGFVIAVGAYVAPLLNKAKATAKKIGVVSVEMGATACKVPAALAYIEKIESMQRVGRKQKTIRC